MMGEAWERAQVRLWRDIANGASREAEWGPLGAPAGSTLASEARPRELCIGAVESTGSNRDQVAVKAVKDLQLT
jgi:hypothetical protein